MLLKKKDILVLSACAAGFLLLCIMVVFAVKAIDSSRSRTLQIPAIQHLNVPFKQPTASIQISSEFAADSVYSSSESFGANTASVQEVMITAEGANAELYAYCSQYFHASYGYQSLSPVLPMAIANVETPGRADFSVTWSALFPSRVVPVSEMGTFDVISVVSNPSYYAVLSKEYSTRDRGALQMSPTYGTGNAILNAKMSGTEKEKLSSLNISQYSIWVSGASDKPGDRFFLPDVLLRMSAAMQGQCDNIVKNRYIPDNDFQLLAMCAMGHQSSGVWGNTHNKKIGCWKSGTLAYEWSKIVGSQEMISALTEYAQSSQATYIDTATARRIVAAIGSYDTSLYATKDSVCYYPVKVLYSYIKLCMLYTQ